MNTGIKHNLTHKVPGESFSCINDYLKNRLYFTHLDEDGIKDMFEYSSKEIFYRHMGRKPHMNIEDTKDYYKELLGRIKNGHHGGSAMYWFIRTIKDKKTIGTVGLMGINEKGRIAEIGKGLSPSYWGKGYSYELLGTMIEYTFNDLNMESIISMTQQSNIPNIKLMATGGFKIKERFKNHIDGVGFKVDYVKLELKKKFSTPELCYQKANLKYNKYPGS